VQQRAHDDLADIRLIVVLPEKRSHDSVFIPAEQPNRFIQLAKSALLHGSWSI
jgi:hypothetical protein